VGIEASRWFSGAALISSGQRRLAIGRSGTAVDPYKSAHNTGWITNRQTISRDISGHDATRADSGVASNANSGKDYRVRADPHVVFDDNWCGWRRYLTLFDAKLVPIDDKQVMTQQTVAADLDLFVCRNRWAVVNERMIAYRDTGTLVRDDFDRDNVPH
jgi:hypothetical protein